MKGRERALIEVGISATLGAYVSLWEATPEDLMGLSIYGKKDTKVFDAYPEIRMRSIINGYDDTIIFVTEEQEPKRSEWPKFTDKYSREIVMIADPLDRSKFFGKLLLQMATGKEKIPLYELFKKNSQKKIWEEEVGDAPAIITGATTALSCLEGGVHSLFHHCKSYYPDSFFSLSGRYLLS